MEQKYGAVIPAAGISSRLGRFKPMLPVGEETLIRRIVRVLRESGVENIVVISGYHHLELERELQDEPVRIIYNPHFAETDMHYSFSLGIRELQGQCSRVILCPADMVMVFNDTVRTLMEADEDLVVPVFRGKRGHPVIFSSSLIPELLDYPGEDGLKGAFAFCRVSPSYISVDDEGVLLELNTKKDYENMLRDVEAISGVPTRLHVGVEVSFFTGIRSFFALIQLFFWS